MEPDDFLDWYKGRVQRRTGRAPAAMTLRSKAGRLRVALKESGLEGWESLGTLTSDPIAVERLLDKLALRMSTGSLRLAFDALRDFNEYARVKGWAEDNGLAGMTPPPQNPRKAIYVYTPAEVEALVSAARGVSLRWWAFLSTLALTGRRVGEVLGLEWAWLHLEAEVPHFELPHTKNTRQCYVPLSTTLTDLVFTPEHLAKLRTGEGNRQFHRDPAVYVFPWSYSCVEKMFRRHTERVGVPNRGFHNFRHTKATEMLARGVPIQAVSSLLGHASVSTTDRIYSHATSLDYARYIESDYSHATCNSGDESHSLRKVL